MIKLNKEFLNKLKLSNLKKDFFDLFKGITIKEVLIFLLFPVFITILMLLPSTIRNSLSFKVYDYSWWQFFTHAFIHLNFSHLWHNLQGYFIFGFLLLIFANRTKDKNKLLWLFLITIISLPFISSLIEIFMYPAFMPMIKTSQGSSGLVSAILGFFPMLWIYHLSKKQKQNLINVNFFNLCGLYVALLFTVIYYPIHKNILFIIVISMLIILFIFMYKKHIKSILKGIFEESKMGNILFYFLMILLPVFFMVAPLLLFPVKIVQGNSLVDFFMHYIGLIYGIILSFIFFKMNLYHS